MIDLCEGVIFFFFFFFKKHRNLIVCCCKLSIKSQTIQVTLTLL